MNDFIALDFLFIVTVISIPLLILLAVHTEVYFTVTEVGKVEQPILYLKRYVPGSLT